MSPRPPPSSGHRLRPAHLAVLALGLSWCVLVASGCGSASDPLTGGVTSTVRSEPVTGRDSAASTTTGPGEPTTPATSPSTPSTSGPATSGPATEAETGQPGVSSGAAVLVDQGLQPLLGRRVGLIANRASTVDGERLIDILARHQEVDLVALFAPEHGVGAAGAAGEAVLDGVDPATGVPVQSLYDDDRAPDAEVLAGLDLLVFDLQDVGARFYTYVSTLGLAMAAAAEAGVPVLVLDRPNPLGGDRPDGPTLVDGYDSFVGLYPIPALPGLTVGELALAIRGEGWIEGLDRLELDVIEAEGWDRSQRWSDTGLAWTAPSPGLPRAELAQLYPATVLLEATTVSFGRGTDRPFGQFGAAWLDADAMVERLDRSGLAGLAFETVTFADEDGEIVNGVNLTVTDPAAVRPMAAGVHVIHHLLALAGDEVLIDRPDFFDLLAGTGRLRRDLTAGEDPAVIVGSWSAELDAWATVRAPYLLYPETAG